MDSSAEQSSRRTYKLADLLVSKGVPSEITSSGALTRHLSFNLRACISQALEKWVHLSELKSKLISFVFE